MISELKIRPLLVFTSKYESDSSLDRIGVENTRELLEKAIFTKDGLNIPNDNGIVLNNETYVRACDLINNFIQSIDGNNEICFFYFCGHGFPDYHNENLYLAMSDTTTTNWNTCGYDIKSIISLIKLNRLKNYIIILDCCHSGFLCNMGNHINNLPPIDIEHNDESEGAVYIASSMADDVCNQICIDSKYYIPFSYHLAKSLLGEYSTTLSSVSISEIYNIIKGILDKTNYVSKTIMQARGNLDKMPLFTIKQSTDINIYNFNFSSYFKVEKLNVLLVKTAIEHPIKYDDFGVPLGLWMLKGYLSTTGLNLNIEIYDERLELRKCNNDKNKRRIVMEQFSQIIENYDVIGISVCSSELPPALKKFKIAKEHNKITLCGGIFATSNEEYLVNTGVIDYVIAGVGTVPLGNLLAKLSQEKMRKTLGKHIINEYGVASKEYFYLYDMPWTPAQLPTMRQSMWIEILDRYRPYLGNRMDVYTARGCDKNCSFCSVQKESHQVIYRKEDDCVIEEIQYLKSVGIKYFSFKDEDFFSKPYRMMKILKSVAAPGINFKIRARYDEVVTSGISLEELQSIGVDEIQYGIESPDLYIRKAVKKGYASYTNQDLVNFIKKHADYNITANCSFILGINGESTDYYTNLKNFIKEIYNDKSKPKIYINFLTPHPFNSQFPLNNYKLVTNDLNYFTHKYPVCFSQSSSFVERKKMLKVYDDIVKYSNSEKYNPLTSTMPEELKNAFTFGKGIDVYSLI